MNKETTAAVPETLVAPNTIRVDFGTVKIGTGDTEKGSWQGGSILIGMSNPALLKQLEQARESAECFKEAMKGLLEFIFEKEEKESSLRRIIREMDEQKRKAAIEAHNKWAEKINAERRKEYSAKLEVFDVKWNAYKEALNLWRQRPEEERGDMPHFYDNQPTLNLEPLWFE